MNGSCEHDYEIQYSFIEGAGVGCRKCRRACRVLPKLKKWSELAGYLLVLAGILAFDPNHMTDKWWEFVLVVVAVLLTIPFADWLEYRLLLRAQKKGTLEKYVALLPGKKYMTIAQREAEAKLIERFEKLFDAPDDEELADIDEFISDDEEEPADDPEPCSHENELHYGICSGLEIVCPVCGQTGQRKRTVLSVWRPVMALLTLAACVFLSARGMPIDEYFQPALYICAAVYFTAAWLEYRILRRAQKAGQLEKYVKMP